MQRLFLVSVQVPDMVCINQQAVPSLERDELCLQGAGSGGVGLPARQQQGLQVAFTQGVGALASLAFSCMPWAPSAAICMLS